MPIPEAGDILLTMKGFCFGQRIMLTQWFNKENASTGTQTIHEELDAFLDEIINNDSNLMIESYLACLPTSYRLTEFRMQLVYPLRYAYISRTVDMPGTHASPATVANDAAALTFRGAVARREDVATKHIGPIPDAASAAGLLTGPYKVLLETLATAMKGDYAVGTIPNIYSPEIYHRKQPGTSSPILFHRVGEQSRVQRRRTVGLGE